MSCYAILVTFKSCPHQNVTTAADFSQKFSNVVPFYMFCAPLSTLYVRKHEPPSQIVAPVMSAILPIPSPWHYWIAPPSTLSESFRSLGRRLPSKRNIWDPCRTLADRSLVRGLITEGEVNALTAPDGGYWFLSVAIMTYDLQLNDHAIPVTVVARITGGIVSRGQCRYL